MSAPCSKLPSNISTMKYIDFANFAIRFCDFVFFAPVKIFVQIHERKVASQAN